SVVFKRVDKRSGKEEYVYHGNDGTTFPWNDTAQLNYLNAAVREGVIQTILHVARQFPIIRFDAAMTLAKRHFQRLWFPDPGTGGAIPSRAEFGLTKAQFDAAMPEEFWREVVDRVAAEAPDTLLLAEAFWLMESYFVRTLGMHRVYNSAFMVLLRDEDNAKYRQLMKQTLEFDPEILKRYVNFQNNPDERTAVDQFGKGDKYFGVCTLMVTMPGLPMLGHGQIEGFTEKYGMEYQRAYWDEYPDEYLVARHEREIFPLMHKRYLFADVRDFLLYDFYTTDGGVNEDVFAYSNRAGDERSLVVYHNKYAETRGWIRTSAAYAVKTGQGDERVLRQKILGEGLALRGEDNSFCILRDQVSGLEYIRNSKELTEKGMYVELGAYKCHVFLDIREVQDNAWRQYAELTSYLGGRGVPSVDEALKELVLQPITRPFKELANADLFRRLYEARATDAEKKLDAALLDEVETKATDVLASIKNFTDSPGDPAEVAADVRRTFEAVLLLPVLAERFPETATSAKPARPAAASVTKKPAATKSAKPAVSEAEEAPLGDYPAALKEIGARLDSDTNVWPRIFGWASVQALGKLADMENYSEQSRGWIDEWLLGRAITSALQDFGLDYASADRAVVIIKRLTSHQQWFAGEDGKDAAQLIEALLADTEMQRLLGVNRYQGVLWFDKQAFERLSWWLLLLAAIGISADEDASTTPVAERIAARYRTIQQLREAAATSGYQVEKLLERVQGTAE
ncbi:MAG TPA: alpha-amylase, partial [Roseiflexaceae bacterium]|nr:alpha-amylase [Roseiflexaceae bacterium]